MQSTDAMVGNIAKIAALFPQCVTEKLNGGGNPVYAIDFDKLRAELSDEIVGEGEERYQFTWPDKKASGRLANTPSTMTLRPCPEESVGRDGSAGGFDSENLYIEGDNLEVLKILREDYLGAIKMIYIDPPYNTGNDFVYNDDFAQNRDEYEAGSGAFDAEGNQMLDPMQRNTEANGRFHTDWLNMIYPRLKVARELLSDDGVIFISIDDNEQENLKKVCEEVFGSQNFVAELIWERAYSPKNDARFISNSHDYVLMFAKDINSFVIGRLDRTEEANARYSNPDNDPRGPWKPSDMSVKTYNAECDYPITTPSGRIVEPPAARCWSLSRKAFRERLLDNRIWFGSDGNSVPCIKRFLSELKFEGMAPTSILFYKEVGHSQEGAKEVTALFGDKGVFDGPKPVRLLQRLITLANLHDDSIVLDFFSGSATTAHALMNMNVEKNKHCKFILVQVQEKVSDTKKDQGYATICEIGKERIRRAGKKIMDDASEIGKESIRHAGKKLMADLFTTRENARISQNIKYAIGEDNNKPKELWDYVNTEEEREQASKEEQETDNIMRNLDIGFRVLKLDSSNMKDVYYTPGDLDAASLFDYVDNVKPDRSSLDLLFQVLPELNIELSAKIEEKEIHGKKVYMVNGTYLIATFDKGVNESTITEIAKLRPLYFVMRDASAENDNVLDNFEQIFKHYSPDTIRRIL